MRSVQLSVRPPSLSPPAPRGTSRAVGVLLAVVVRVEGCSVGPQTVHPEGCAAGKAMLFPARGQNPGLAGRAGGVSLGHGAPLVLGMAAGCHRGCLGSC